MDNNMFKDMAGRAIIRQAEPARLHILIPREIVSEHEHFPMPFFIDDWWERHVRHTLGDLLGQFLHRKHGPSQACDW